MAAHSMRPLDRGPTAGVALALTVLAHRDGWCFPRGGAQRLADALASYLRSLGGEIVTDAPIASLDELPPARAVLCDLSPKPLLRIAGGRFPPRYRRALGRYQYGPGVYKVDWLLDGPVPWRNAECARAGEQFLNATLPLGDKGHTQSPQEYLETLSRTSGLPHNMVRRNMQKINDSLVHMREVLNGLTRGLPLEVIDKGIGEQSGSRVCFFPRSASLGVVMPRAGETDNSQE